MHPLPSCAPIPSHRHRRPRGGGSRRNSLGNSRPLSQDLAPHHWLTVSNLPSCGHRGEAVGHGAWQGCGPRGRVCGEVGVSPLSVCAAWMMGALGLCPRGCRLPRCFASCVCARSGTHGATRGILGGPGFGGGHVPQSLGSAAQPGCCAGTI